MLAGLEMMHEEPKLFARLKTLLTVREVWGSIPGTVKSDTVSPTARHCGDVSSELYSPGAEQCR